MISQAVLDFLHSPLLGHGLLLLYQGFLFHLGLFVEVVLLDKVLCVRQTQKLFLLTSVQDQSFAELLANHAKVFGVEVVIHLRVGWSFLGTSMGLVLHWFRPTEWSLHRENIWMLLPKVSPHCHSSGLLLASTNTESRVIIWKVRLSYFRHQEWEDSRSLLLLIRAITIHEHIFSSAMSVEVTVKSQWSFLGELHNELFGIVNSWMEDLTWVLPSSIQVTTS